MVEHDFKKYPELSNNEIQEMPFDSPHRQITEDFFARVVGVHDGDTVRLKCEFRDFTFPLRFLDIDAPEMNAGGVVARDWLREQILETEVLVRIEKNNRVDKYGRLLGRVVSAGLDMGDTMLRLGLVWKFGNRREGELPVFDGLIKKWL